MKNKIILTVALFLGSLCMFGQAEAAEQVTEGIKPNTDTNTIIYIALGVIVLLLVLGLIAVYTLLSKQIDVLSKKSLSPRKDSVDNNLQAEIVRLQNKLKALDEKLAELQMTKPATLKDEEKEDKPKEEIQPREEKPKPKEEVFYANYRSQDKCFKLNSSENDGWMIWKIIKQSPTEATYELADVSSSSYGEQWSKIREIVTCAVAPSGTIKSARTIMPGKLQNVDGVWRVDSDSMVNIEFVCE